MKANVLQGKGTPPPYPGMVLDWIKLMGWGNPSFPKRSIGTWHLATGSMCSVRQGLLEKEHLKLLRKILEERMSLLIDVV